VGKSFACSRLPIMILIIVLEISSFQLDGMFDFKAEVSVLLNITPDHLDRYDNTILRNTPAQNSGCCRTKLRPIIAFIASTIRCCAATWNT
jgi:hypothetical protein